MFHSYINRLRVTTVCLGIKQLDGQDKESEKDPSHNTKLKLTTIILIVVVAGLVIVIY
jgi:hypothetical protein